MPERSIEEIKALVVAGDIFGITIDTAVFDKYGCNLRFPMLGKLDQFKSAKEHVLISEIVRYEIIAHIAQAAAETQSKLKAAVNQHRKRWHIEADAADLPGIFKIGTEPKELAAQQVNDYLERISAQVVPASGDIDVSPEVLSRYFETRPPFESKKDKKAEFPDAFALLSLEKVIFGERGYLLCVSPDGGWQSFSAESEKLICVPDLETVLSIFNESGRACADRVMALWRTGLAAALNEEVEHAFEYRLADNDFLIDVYSYCEVDPEPVSAVMQSFQLDAATDPIVISSEDDEVTFVITLPALVDYEAGISFYARDSVDKDLVHLTNETHSMEQSDDFEVAITVSKNFDAEPEVLNVDIAKRRLEVAFGDVEPFADENPYHEKY